jgi:hypothetical protein
MNFKLVLYLFRFLNLFLLIFAIWEVPRKVTGNTWASLILLLVIFTHPYIYFFLTHARYDTPIFIISFLYFGLLAENREYGKRSLFYSAVLLTSSSKGVYYFSAFALVLAFKYFFERSFRTKDEYLKYFISVFCAFATIVGLFYFAGVLPQFIATFRSQLFLAQDGLRDDAAFSFISGEYLRKAPFFYFLVIISMFSWKKVYRHLPERFGVSVYIFILLAFGWFYFISHPVAFSPMTIAADLAGALLVVAVLPKVALAKEYRIWFLFLAACFFLVQLAVNPYMSWVFPHYEWGGLPVNSYVDFPDRIRNKMGANDVVFDPAGLLYFAKPCSNEWYLDAPYSLQLDNHKWMQNINWNKCNYAIYISQVSHMKLEFISFLSQEYRYIDYPLMKNRNIAE